MQDPLCSPEVWLSPNDKEADRWPAADAVALSLSPDDEDTIKNAMFRW